MIPPTHEELRSLPLHTLVERFNQSCEGSDCRVATHYVSETFCTAHQRYYDELKRRQDLVEQSEELPANPPDLPEAW